MNLRLLLLACISLLLSACDPTAPLLAKIDAERGAVARSYFEHLHAGRIDAIVADLDPGLRKSSGTESAFTQMRSLLPNGEPVSQELIGYRWFTPVGQPTQYSLTYQYGYPEGRWVVWDFVYRQLESGGVEILGMHVNPLTESLRELNRFTFVGKGWLHYLFLVACLLSVLVIGVSVVVCVRTPIRRRKWLWIVCILVGVGQFSLNWTTGEWGVQPLFLGLLGAGVFKAGTYVPWMVSFSLPIGAVVFWLRRGDLIRAATPPVAPPNLPVDEAAAPSCGPISGNSDGDSR